MIMAYQSLLLLVLLLAPLFSVGAGDLISSDPVAGYYWYNASDDMRSWSGRTSSHQRILEEEIVQEELIDPAARPAAAAVYDLYDARTLGILGGSISIHNANLPVCPSSGKCAGGPGKPYTPGCQKRYGCSP